MGYKITTPVWDNSKAKGADLLVLIAIADSADNETGLAFPSIKYLAEKSRLTERAVQYSITRLKKSGELEVIQNTGRVSTFRVTLFSPRLSPGEEKRLIAKAEAMIEQRQGGEKIAPLGGEKIAPLGGENFAPGGVNGGAPRGVQSTTFGIECARVSLEPVITTVSLSLTSGERENCLKELKRIFPEILSIPETIPSERAYLFLHKVRTGEIKREQIYSPVAYMVKMQDEDISGPLLKEREREARKQGGGR